MYAAKRLGRNRVFAAADPATSALANQPPSFASRDERTLSGLLEALALLADARDHATAKHLTNISALATELALELKLNPAQAKLIGAAGKLHDIGKVGVPDAVLHKEGQLDEPEWELMRAHPSLAADALARIPSLADIAPVVRGHHERWDGKGYPDALARESIPLGSRILAVADSFGAITTHRPHRPAKPVDWALGEVRRCAGSQFDPDVVSALERLLSRDGKNSLAHAP
jgi:HD-GYP domain-containing protein (c-di-GMP phosphodiesterase class II)